MKKVKYSTYSKTIRFNIEIWAILAEPAPALCHGGNMSSLLVGSYWFTPVRKGSARFCPRGYPTTVVLLIVLLPAEIASGSDAMCQRPLQKEEKKQDP